ncbi:MAG TPA: DUF1772 domain-containing protein [Candidatus Solibacter sp.]|nr:DUF1772 domain-containing protein [Candidatus Solibacter sp.]
MLVFLIQFAALILASLVGGVMFAVWLIFNPAGQTAQSYVVLQQQAIRTLNTAMPRLGFLTILATLVTAVTLRADHRQFMLLLGAAICFACAGLITRFLNQPINAIVITWESASPPATWPSLRDAWWRWHLLRLSVGLLGLGFAVASALEHV